MTSPDPRLERLERAVRQNARWTTCLMLLFIALVVGTAIYGYVQARQVLDPDRLADSAEGYIKDNYPEWREDVKQQLKKAAPDMARRMKEHAEKQLPKSRVRLQRYLDREAKDGIARAQLIADKDFRKFLQDNRADVKKGFAEVKNSPKELPAFVGDMEGRLDKQFSVNLRREAGVVLEAVDRLNAKLARLAEGKNLNQTEQLERRITQELRALQKKGKKKAEEQASR